MLNKKKIFGTLMAIMLSAGISFGNNNCEAYAQRWERLLSSTIDILLDRDIEPPYMHGYAFVEPEAAIFMPPRMERRMGILGALAEFVEMLPPPLPPEPTIVVVRHHRPLPRHLRPLRKFEHFHHPVRNIHKPAIVRGRVVPHKVRHKDLAVLHKPRMNRPIAPHKPPMMKKAAAPHKPPMMKKAAAPHKPPMMKKAAAPRKPMVKKAAAPRKPMVKKPVTLRKPIKSPKIARPQAKPQYRKPSSSYKRPQPKPQYRKPSSSYKRPQPKPQYRKSSSSGSKRPANNNEQYWQKKRY